MSTLDPSVNDLLQSAAQLYQAGDLPLAISIYRQVLARDPLDPTATHYLGLALSRQGQAQPALELLTRSIELAPTEAAFRINFAQFLRALGKIDQAVEESQNAVRLAPQMAAAHNGLGVCLAQQDKLDEAIAAFNRATELQPNWANPYNNLGVALKNRGRSDRAVEVLRKAVALEPRDPSAYNNLGNALIEQGRPDEAIAALQQALRRRPDYAQAHANLGNALLEKGRCDDAISQYRNAVRLDSRLAASQNNLANCLVTQGFIPEAIATYRAALAVKPDPVFHSNLLLAMHYDAAFNAAEMYREHLLWADQIARPLYPRSPRTYGTDRDPARRLRVGYVSPDFRHHPVAAFIEPLLREHDHSQFEIVCYSDVQRPDSVTERLQPLADRWVNVAGSSDAMLAEQIAADGIDILVDLAGHIDHNRLLVFATKPAPVQVTYLGYPDTTGLATMDYRLTDAWHDPPEADAFHAEKLVRIPDSAWCYRPWTLAQVGPLPASSAGHITFGSLNNLAKLTPQTLDCWARILLTVPTSRLVLLAQPQSSGAARIERLLAARAVTADRLLFFDKVPYEKYIELFNTIDVGLDPFPYNGHTTTCNALWMGVPVVALRGQTHVSRAGVSVLCNVGLCELIADSGDDYVRAAIGLASDLAKLAQLRAGLRARVQASPLADARGFARKVEQAYRAMWKHWCATA